MIFIILSIFQAYHNLIDARKGLTPCMKEGISDYIGLGENSSIKKYQWRNRSN